MELLRECFAQCPYCGETISLLVDCSCADQSYTEDCQVCCQPMLVWVWIDEDLEPHMELRREDE